METRQRNVYNFSWNRSTFTVLAYSLKEATGHIMKADKQFKIIKNKLIHETDKRIQEVTISEHENSGILYYMSFD